MKEAKLRMEDALAATKAAVEEGIIAGGGSAYIHAAKKVEKVVEKLEGINGFVVSIHPLRFWREISPCLGGNGCIGNKHLNLMVAYSIVRVEDKQIQAYGATYVDDTFTFAMTKGNWENVLEKIAKKIVKKTPLEK